MCEWIGYGVSLYLGEPLGWYQGIITEVKSDAITLKKAFRNGFPYPTPTVTLRAADIKELKIVFTADGPKDEYKNKNSDSFPEEDQQCDPIKQVKKNRHYDKKPKRYQYNKTKTFYNSHFKYGIINTK